MTLRTLLACILVAAVGGGAARAQSVEGLRGSSGAYYTFADPSDITVEVKVWGAVSNPGLYQVRQGMQLSTLLTLAGGPQATVRERGRTSTLTLRLFRPRQDGSYDLLFRSDMENEILVLEQDPVLLHGDVLVVEEAVRQRFSWRDGLSLVTAVGTLALVLDRIIRLSN